MQQNDNLYNRTGERLWEKLEYYRDIINTDCVDFKQPFPIYQLIEVNPFVKNLVKAVEKEYNYQMSEFQCSWAANQFIKGGLKMMQEYNEHNHTNLAPQP